MALLPPYELTRRGNHILNELNGYTIAQKIQLLRYLLDILVQRKQRGDK